MTMSWLADRKATTKAIAAIKGRFSRGSPVPRMAIDSASRHWIASIQPRRRPSQRVSSGSESWSINGDHRNFSV